MNKQMKYVVRPWVVWFIPAFFTLFQFVLQGSPSVMVPSLMRDLHVDAAQIGWLTSAYFMTYIALQLPIGLLVDRLGARYVLTVSAFICCISCFWFAYADTFLAAILSRMMMGVGTAAALVGTFYLAARWFPIRKFALLVGLTEMLAMLGGGWSSELMALTVEHSGWRYTLVGFALLSFIGIFLVFFFVRDQPEGFVEQNNDGGSLKKELGSVIKQPQIWVCGIYSGLLFAVIPSFAGLWLIPFLVTRYNLAIEVAAWGSVALFVGLGLGGPLLGWLSGRYNWHRRLMFAGNVLLLVTLLLVLTWSDLDFLAMCLLLFVVGFASSTYILPFARVGDISSIKVRGTAMGFANMLIMLVGAPLLQPLMGWLIKSHWDGTLRGGLPIYSLSDYRLAIAALPITVALGFVCWALLRDVETA